MRTWIPVRTDIDRAGEALKHAKNGRIHTFISSSDVQIQHQLRSDKSTVLKRAREMVGLARSYTSDVEFSPMDASRTGMAFLEELVQAAIEAARRRSICPTPSATPRRRIMGVSSAT